MKFGSKNPVTDLGYLLKGRDVVKVQFSRAISLSGRELEPILGRHVTKGWLDNPKYFTVHSTVLLKHPRESSNLIKET